MSLDQEISNWNGKSFSDIEAIYSLYHESDSFGVKVVELCHKLDLQKGATWLLKRYLEAGRKVEAKSTRLLFKNLSKLECWESKLHVLQCLPYLKVGNADKKNVETFLRNCLGADHKFVRAWAYNGFYEISLQYPEYKEEAKTFFDMAMRDETPSVKARIRNIMKKGF